MKAVFMDRHGGPEVLKYGELRDPVPKPREIVADVHAAIVNAADWKVRIGGSVYVQAQFPHVLGRDFSGVVSAVGEGVAGFRPKHIGARVITTASAALRKNVAGVLDNAGMAETDIKMLLGIWDD